ncbi:MAG: beta-ketoacyl-[acyl-carrier-protein] synthase family protein [Burkholderiales bacterium]
MRVCVTGYGVICPSGADVPTALDQLWNQRSAIRAVSGPVDHGGERMACGLCAEDIVPDGLAPHLVRGIDRVSLLSLVSARQALHQAEASGALQRAEMPLVWGCGMGGLGTLDQGYHDLLTHHKQRLRPTTVPYAMPSAPAFHVAHHLGVRGPSSTLTVACASSALAIAQGARLIASGEASAVLVGGVESMLKPVILRAWQMSQTVCDAEEDHPEQSCRPFSSARHGFAMGEGAASLVLESEASARERGAQVLGWVRGWGHTTDALHISRPDTAAQAQAMRQALAHAGVRAAEVAYLNAHGTATPAGDISEAQAILALFGQDNPGLPVSSTKAMHGHLIGASGALEAIVTLASLRAGLLPGNPHSAPLDEQVGALNVFAAPIRLAPDAPRLGMSNSFAFGGVNVALVLEGAHD